MEEIKDLFSKDVKTFIPPKVFAFGNVPTLPNGFKHHNISNLNTKPSKPEALDKKIQVYQIYDDKVENNFPQKIHNLIRLTLTEKDLYVPPAFSQGIHLGYYFHDATDRFESYDFRMVKKMIHELQLFVFIVINKINLVSERQIKGLYDNILRNIDEKHSSYQIVSVSDKMKGTLICGTCHVPCSRSDTEWWCDNAKCDVKSRQLLSNGFGYQELCNKTLVKFQDMFLHRWSLQKSKISPFKSHHGSHVTLYQDALTGIHWSYKESIQDVVIHNCYEDMYDSILNAKQFVYIFAWSMKHDLIPCPGKSRPLTVEQLLKNRAEEIQVCVALWNKDSSLMPTDNLTTEKAFKGSKVNIKMIDNNYQTLIPCSHHLKMIMCDGPNGNAVAFLGGLDLASGRLDNPDHSLYDEQGNKKVPWHDIHGKIDGKAALDVIKSFEDRWMTTKPDIPLVTQGKKLAYRKNGTWVSQVVRSDTMNGYIEKGLQAAFINAIRNAEKFIYIENQYFCGASSEWTDFSIVGGETLAPNIVPFEILNKIYEMILLKRYFKVYIVLPYRPWGDSDGTGRFGLPSKTLKLHITTMQMMYYKLTEFLKLHNLLEVTNARNYLRFYCLGQCEKDREKGTMLSYMIYTHSKMMIVDDEYIILGSGNMNERSFSGDKDTEISFGAYQSTSSGAVKEFRRSLWKEHLGTDKEWDNPESQEVFDLVNERVAINTDNFNNEEKLANGHMISLKFSVNRDGKMKDEGDLIYSNVKVMGGTSGIVPFSWLS